MIRLYTAGVLCLLLWAASAHGQEYPGFRVIGRHLYDRCGGKVILRGVSNPNIWFQRDGLPHYAEIEKTGANVVRIVWETRGTAAQLDAAISNCISHSMIPMVECHDATGDWSKLVSVVDYWTRPDIAEVLRRYEADLLLNIANEAGDASVTATQFREGYEAAVLRIREAGIHVPLVIDGTDWGKNIRVLQSEGPYLIEADPDRNLLFSVHMWWPRMYGYVEADIPRAIEASVRMELPLIVGEFSRMHGSCDEKNITADNSIPYRTLIKQCHLHEIGYIAWSWFGNCNPFWDMTADGTFETLYDWGLEVAVTDSFSILNTSVRPYSIVHGECDPASVRKRYGAVPDGLDLMPAYPNPFNLHTTIPYRISGPAHVRLEILDVYGARVRTLIDRPEPAGFRSAPWDGLDDSGGEIPSGAYFCRLIIRHEGSQREKTRKMTLIK